MDITQLPSSSPSTPANTTTVPISSSTPPTTNISSTTKSSTTVTDTIIPSTTTNFTQTSLSSTTSTNSTRTSDTTEELGKEAIIGIAVGSGIVLLVFIGVILGFVLHRRHRRKRNKPPRTPPPSKDLLEQKYMALSEKSSNRASEMYIHAVEDQSTGSVQNDPASSELYENTESPALKNKTLPTRQASMPEQPAPPLPLTMDQIYVEPDNPNEKKVLEATDQEGYLKPKKSSAKSVPEAYSDKHHYENVSHEKNEKQSKGKQGTGKKKVKKETKYANIEEDSSKNIYENTKTNYQQHMA